MHRGIDVVLLLGAVSVRPLGLAMWATPRDSLAINLNDVVIPLINQIARLKGIHV